VSSGFNGIGIRSVGRTREKLADMLNEKLGLVDDNQIQAEDLKRTNPYHRHYEDCCAWDCMTNERPVSRHIYSWATMSHLAKHGFSIPDTKAHDIEV
jgi:hypothetical protein